MVPTEGGSVRRAAVLGAPVAHSLSPVLHRAAYAALGLRDWTYERVECDAAGVAPLVASLDEDWVGLSVTMPGKDAALRVAQRASVRAVSVGAANTLVQVAPGEWRADCTDVDGVVGALLCAGGYQPDPSGLGVVLGAGGTARAAVVAMVELGVRNAVVVARDPARALAAQECAAKVGLPCQIVRWADTDFADLAGRAAVLVSTTPASAVEPLADVLAEARCVLDVIYHPWPTTLATAVLRRGGKVATGLDMLLHQAFSQVEQFTGQPAPRAVMREALRGKTGTTLDLPVIPTVSDGGIRAVTLDKPQPFSVQVVEEKRNLQ